MHEQMWEPPREQEKQGSFAEGRFWMRESKEYRSRSLTVVSKSEIGYNQTSRVIDVA